VTQVAVQNFQAKRVLSVLVADDSPIIQTILLRILTNLGHKVVMVGNGLEAVGAVRSKDFDVVVMDMHMPEMDGATATRSIRGTPTDIAFTPIIACSVDNERDHVESFFEAGVNAYMEKPIDTEVLLQTIDEVLDEKIHELIMDGDRTANALRQETSDSLVDESDGDIDAFLDTLKSIE